MSSSPQPAPGGETRSSFGEPQVEGAGLPLLVAIDGPAGSGKSTLARALASRFNLAHLETGAMYRALGLKAISTGTQPGDTEAIRLLLASTDIQLEGDRVLLDGTDVADRIRSHEVSNAASRVAEVPEVRTWCVARQREIAARNPVGAVVEGRDIGTVVLPDAQIKIYLTADLDQRASRRALEAGADSAETLHGVRSRDKRDTERAASPLVAAEDAIVIDTTEHSSEEIRDRVIRLIELFSGGGRAVSSGLAAGSARPDRREQAGAPAVDS